MQCALFGVRLGAGGGGGSLVGGLVQCAFEDRVGLSWAG